MGERTTRSFLWQLYGLYNLILAGFDGALYGHIIIASDGVLDARVTFNSEPAYASSQISNSLCKSFTLPSLTVTSA